MPTTSIEDLCQSIERLVDEHLRACHEQVAATIERSFGSSSPSSTRKRSTGTKSPKPREAGRRRTEAELAALAERFHELLRERPGETMAVLAAQLGLTPRELHRPVARLKRAQLVRAVGSRNHTRYFPMVNGKALRARA